MLKLNGDDKLMEAYYASIGGAHIDNILGH